MAVKNGIAVAYNGTPINLASDYSKSIDSRWKFLEVAFENTVDIEIPAIASSGSNVNNRSQRFQIVNHGLGFYPLFEVSVVLFKGTLAGGSFPSQSINTVLSDKENLYLFPYFDNIDGQNAVTARVIYRVYNLDISQSYTAIVESASSASATKNPMGVKFLDGSESIDIDDDSPVGFSIDTTKKTLSVHSVQIVDFDDPVVNGYVYHTVGYPPTYLAQKSPYVYFGTNYGAVFNIPWRYEVYTSPMENPDYRNIATDTYLRFTGVQSFIGGQWCFIILKDPAELAK